MCDICCLPTLVDECVPGSPSCGFGFIDVASASCVNRVSGWGFSSVWFVVAHLGFGSVTMWTKQRMNENRVVIVNHRLGNILWYGQCVFVCGFMSHLCRDSSPVVAGHARRVQCCLFGLFLSGRK